MSSDIADRKTAEDYDHEQEFDCAMCRITWSPYSGFHNPNSTYAKLLRTAADGCELCELLCRLSETACTGANTMVQDDDVVSASTLGRAHASPAYLRVSRKGETGTFQGLLHFRLAHYMSCTDTAGYYCYPVLFYTKSGKAYIAYENIRSGRIGCSLTNRRKQLPLAFPDLKSHTR